MVGGEGLWNWDIFLSFGRALAFVALEVGRRDTSLPLGGGR